MKATVLLNGMPPQPVRWNTSLHDFLYTKQEQYNAFISLTEPPLPPIRSPISFIPLLTTFPPHLLTPLFSLLHHLQRKEERNIEHSPRIIYESRNRKKRVDFTPILWRENNKGKFSKNSKPLLHPPLIFIFARVKGKY